MIDPQLAYDAAQMREGVQSAFWSVLKRRLETARDMARDRALNPMESDVNTHHWRGVYTGIIDLLALPERIIEADQRAQKD